MINEETLKVLLDPLYEKFDINIYNKQDPGNHYLISKEVLRKQNIKFDDSEPTKIIIYNNDKEMFVYRKSHYPNNTTFGKKLSHNKIETEKYLKIANVNTTNSEVYTEKQYEQAKADFEKQEKVVIKPLALQGSLGVFTNVNNKNFKTCWDSCIQVQKQNNVIPKIVIQDKIQGFDYRFLVVEGKFVSATLRTPAHLVGDGRSTISELIKNKNSYRKSNPYLKFKMIKENTVLINRLKSQGRSIDTVLDKGEYCLLSDFGHSGHGGENIDVTDLVSEETKLLSVNAVLATPGIQTAGMDILLEAVDAKYGTVIEVNKAPNLSMSYYPYMGKPRSAYDELFKTMLLDNNIENQVIDENYDISQITERYSFLKKKIDILNQQIESLDKENKKLIKRLGNTE